MNKDQAEVIVKGTATALAETLRDWHVNTSLGYSDGDMTDATIILFKRRPEKGE